MKRKTRAQIKNDLQFIINEEYVRLSTELITLTKRGVYPKSERIKRSDVKLVATNVGLPTLKKLTYEDFRKELAQALQNTKS